MQSFSSILAVLAAALVVAHGGAESNGGCGVVTVTKLISSSPSSIGSNPSSSTSGPAFCKDCSENSKKSKLKMPKRGLSHGTLKPLGKSLDKRTLRTPADYGGNVDSFLLIAYLFADALNINGDHNGIPTGFSEPHATERFSKTVGGLFGCTSVVVASQAGSVDVTFLGKPFLSGKTGKRGQAKRSSRRYKLQKSNNQWGQFSQAQKPVWAIITPRSPGGAARNLKYQPEVDQIQGVLKNLFPGVPPVIIDCVPRSSPQAQGGSSAGKVLFQYDPFEAMVQDPHPNPQDPCKVYQQATFRPWVEDSPDPIFSNNWAAEANQLISDFATYYQNNPQRKRDNAPACSIPSSLLQASMESGSEPNMSPSKAPNPDSTFWATLSHTSSTSPSSSSTPPPPTTSAPPPITSPPPAPSGGVSCGSGSPKFFPASVSFLMMNFCDGNGDYDPGAQPLAQPSLWQS